MSTKTIHVPVLVKEVLEYLDIKPNQNVIDGTVGQGGHAKEILALNAPAGKLLGIDQDIHQVENSRQRLLEFYQRLILVNDSYANVKEIVAKNHFEPVDVILLDIGYSSWQIENPDRGFSFQHDGPLDMRYSSSADRTAAKIINEYSQEDLEKIFDEYGEERHARQIAKEIVRARQVKKIETTFQLNEIVARAVGRRNQHSRIHYATKVYQALRIEVNQELHHLATFLSDALSVLAPGGRLGIISFHSLEDRIVKQFFNQFANEGKANIITKKPVVASEEEVAQNPRSRSAKLRVIIKTTSS